MAWCQGIDGVCASGAEVPHSRMFDRCPDCQKKDRERKARWAQERADGRGDTLMDSEVEDIMADL